MVSRSSSVWWQCGIASTDVAGMLNAGAEDGDHYLSVWAAKVRLREPISVRKCNLEQGSAEWLAWRDGGIGGSEVSSVFSSGWANKTNAGKLWEEKVPNQDGSPKRGGYENKNMKWGKEQESPARFLYEDLFECAVPAICVLHDDYDFMRASLDGLRGDDKLVVEIKCCQEKNHKKMLEIEAVADPLERQLLLDYHFRYYRYQILYQLLITGADRCHLVGYNKNFGPGEQLAVIEVFPEPQEQQRLAERVVDFWSYVERREPPPEEWSKPGGRSPTELKIPA